MTYNNLPIDKTASSSSDATVNIFNKFYDVPIEIDAGTYDAMKGFFESRGFEPVASESIAVTILVQAKKDRLNPMTILDTLKGLESVDISALVAEILNYNRYKTSSLGIAATISPVDLVTRNILA